MLFAAAAVASAASTGTASADDVKIGFLLKTMQEERYKRDRAAFEAKAEELGAEVIFDSANNDELTQLAKFENMLAKGANVIVLQPVNTGTAGSMVSMANRRRGSRWSATTRCWLMAHWTPWSCKTAGRSAVFRVKRWLIG